MRERDRSDGFSLIEVIVVMAIISMLMGFGIGMYQRMVSVGSAQQAVNTVVDTISQVKQSSLAFPSALVVDPANRVVYGLEYRTVQNCNFEDQDDDGIIALALKYGLLESGRLEPYPWGHTGGCAVLDGGTINFGNYPDYDLTEGVSIDVWIYPTENRSMTVLERGDSFGIRLRRGSGGPTVEGFLRLAEPGPQKILNARAVNQTFRVQDHPLLLNRWSRIILSYDRTATTILIDAFGRGAVERLRELESDRGTATTDKEKSSGRMIMPDPTANLVLGPFVGRIDDLKVAGILSGATRPLPEDVDLEGSLMKVRYRDGRLDPAYHRGPVTISFTYKGTPSSITIGTQGTILDR